MMRFLHAARMRAAGELAKGDDRMMRMRRTHEATKVATVLQLKVMRLQKGRGKMRYVHISQPVAHSQHAQCHHGLPYL